MKSNSISINRCYGSAVSSAMLSFIPVPGHQGKPMKLFTMTWQKRKTFRLKRKSNKRALVNAIDQPSRLPFSLFSTDCLLII